MIFSNSTKWRCDRKPRRWLVATVAMTVSVVGLSARAEDWPLVRRDKQGSGVASGSIADQPELLWTYRAGGEAGFEATAVVGDGVIYVGDDAGSFHAVRLTDGQSLWTKSFDDGSFLSGAAVDQDRIYAGDANGIVRCFAVKDGEELWSADVGGEVYAGPTVDGDNLFVTCEAGALTCLNTEDGTRRWNFQIEAPLRCSPTLVSGHILLAGCDSKLHRVAVGDGAEADTHPIDAPTGATAAARGDRAYFGTEGGTFYAIEIPSNGDAKPAEVWTYRDPTQSQPIRAAAAVSDRLVVYGGQSKAVYALDRASGQLKWKLATRSRVDSSPVIVGERIVAATDRGVLYVLNAATGAVKWQFDAGGGFTASPVVVAGRIILGNTDGTLYCFGSKVRKNNHGDTERTERTSRAEEQ